LDKRIEGGSEDQAKGSHAEHPTKHSGTERLPHLCAGAGRDHQRDAEPICDARETSSSGKRACGRHASSNLSDISTGMAQTVSGCGRSRML